VSGAKVLCQDLPTRLCKQSQRSSKTSLRLDTKLDAKQRQNTQPALFQDSLTMHIVTPFIGSVILIAIALDCKPRVVMPPRHLDAM